MKNKIENDLKEKMQFTYDFAIIEDQLGVGNRKKRTIRKYYAISLASVAVIVISVLSALFVLQKNDIEFAGSHNAKPLLLFLIICLIVLVTIVLIFSIVKILRFIKIK